MMCFMEGFFAAYLQSISIAVQPASTFIHSNIKPLLRMTSSCNLYDLCMFDVPLSTYLLQGGAVRRYVSLPCLSTMLLVDYKSRVVEAMPV